jgi:CRISPR-associated protein Cas1
MNAGVLMKIFLDDFGIFLGRKRNRFIVKKTGGEVKEIVADDVDSIICCSSGVAFSASALDLAVENNIQVIFARYRGWPYAVLMPASMTGSVRARREQFIAYNDKRSLILAKKFIAGKLVNQANFLKLMAKNRRQTDPVLAERLYESGKLIDEVNERIGREQGSNIDEKRQQVMNLEAEGARYYWDSIRHILPPELGFTGRETRGARDSFNAMLNFGYQTILFPEVWKAVSYAGLDFYAGYLHADRSGKPSLVLDLMEEFRQQLVDRTLVGLITKGVIKPNEILAAEAVEEGRVLSKDVIKVLLASFQERLDSEVMFNGQKGSLKSFIYLQARCVVRFLLKEAEYVPFCLGW